MASCSRGKNKWQSPSMFTRLVLSFLSMLVRNFPDLITHWFYYFIIGKWVRVELSQTPTIFVQHLLCRLNLDVDSIGNIRHLRPPIPSTSTLAYSWKTFDLDKVKLILQEQDLTMVKVSRSYENGKEVERNDATMSADIILESIMRDVERYGVNQPRPVKQKSSIVVSECEGQRYSREVEFIWFPKLYSESVGMSKLIIRLFIAKTNT